MITPNGEIVDKPANETAFTFWERIEEGNEFFFMNRLTGNLLPTAPIEDVALGAILAEEPGLVYFYLLRCNQFHGCFLAWAKLSKLSRCSF